MAAGLASIVTLVIAGLNAIVSFEPVQFGGALFVITAAVGIVFGLLGKKRGKRR